jgi:hypothetical protein
MRSILLYFYLFAFQGVPGVPGWNMKQSSKMSHFEEAAAWEQIPISQKLCKITKFARHMQIFAQLFAIKMQ